MPSHWWAQVPQTDLLQVESSTAPAPGYGLRTIVLTSVSQAVISLQASGKGSRGSWNLVACLPLVKEPAYLSGI